MKSLHTIILGTSLLGAFSASGAVLTTSFTTPSSGDFASDSVYTTLPMGDSGNQLRVRNTVDSAGQSFTLGTTGDADYQLNSISLVANGVGGSTAEPIVGLTIRLYEGTPVDAGESLEFVSGATTVTAPFFEFTFDATTMPATFNSQNNSYLTFAFEPAEIAAIGDLTAGVEYAFSVGVNAAVEAADIDFRLHRDQTNGYAGGRGFLPGRVLDGVGDETINSDLLFVVNATAVVPEPSSALLSGLASLALLARRRRS